MIRIEDFFIISNSVSDISEEDYQKVDLLVDTFDAISRTTYQSLYIIDYFKKNFLYVSNNPLFLCGHTSEEVKKQGYMFYLNHVPKEEQAMLIKINSAGFEFYNKIPIHDRDKYTISYSFHITNGKKKTLVDHKLTPIRLTESGKIWLAACVVSLSPRDKIGYVKMHKTNEMTYWKYSLKTNHWTEEKDLVLNDREEEIISLSSQGYTMDEIADQIHLSRDTVKFHRKKIFEKMNVKNITEAISFAVNHKLI